MNDTKTGFGAMVKLGIILALYTTVACVSLAFVYAGTKDIINQRLQEELESAIRDLFPGADGFRAISGVTSPDPMVTIVGDANNPYNTGAFAALRNEEIIGMALRTSRFSYSGPIVILTGVYVDNRISGVRILENIDTPGLGSNAGSENFFVDRANGIRFYQQFTGKSVRDPFIARQDVIAITAATITSQAVASSVRAAGEAASAWFAANGGSR